MISRKRTIILIGSFGSMFLYRSLNLNTGLGFGACFSSIGFTILVNEKAGSLVVASHGLSLTLSTILSS